MVAVLSPERAKPELLTEPRASKWRALTVPLFAPVDIAPLVFFRITFGLLMLVEVCAYTFAGVLERNWIEPRLHFTYFGFGWVAAPPDSWMYGMAAALAGSALCIALGLFYRLAAGVFAVAFSWLFLSEQSNYLNHFYLICLLGAVAICLPAHRAFSLDCRRRPELRSAVAPAWTLWLLRAQLGLVYFYGGVAKINHDWLRGEPMRTWLHTGPTSEKVTDFLRGEFFVYLISYGGLAFDLLIVPFLLWKRTRLAALLLACFFHLSNAYLFNIGVFPFLSIALTLLFLPPAWHRKVLRMGPPARAGTPWSRSPLVVLLLASFLIWQFLLPLRHWLYPGNVHWTEEGHLYAWHMMLRTKRGEAYYIVEDRASGRMWRIDPQDHLTRRQYVKMTGRPEMLLQFAHHLRDRWKPREVAVYVVASASLNGRPRALLIDPEVDLAREQRRLTSADWILPLENKRAAPKRYRVATSEFP